MAGDRSLRDFEQWMKASLADADRWLPGLVDLQGDLLERELEARPELRTAGMMQRLLEAGRDVLGTFPERAHELLSVVVQSIPRAEIPPTGGTFLRRLHAQAWLEHARSSYALDRPEEARAAIARAREQFERDPGSGWHLATADLIEAPILHALGRDREALPLLRSAASQFALHRDYERYIRARMMESWILCITGNIRATAEAWVEMKEIAAQHGDVALLARAAHGIGRFESSQGSAERASELLATVIEPFEDARLKREAIDARDCFAEAAALRGRVNEAISRFTKIQAELLAAGELTRAAVLATDILGLLLAADRYGEAVSRTRKLCISFWEAEMPPNALEAFTWLDDRAANGELRDEHLDAVRRYFDRLHRHPNAPFVSPEMRT